MKTLIALLLFSSAAFGQQYTMTQVSTPLPAITSTTPGLPMFYSGYPGQRLILITDPGITTGAWGQNASGVLIGWFQDDGITEAAVWLNGIDNPPTNLNSLVSNATDQLTYAYSVDTKGNILATGIGNSFQPPNTYLLTPVPPVNPLAAEVTALKAQVATLNAQITALNAVIARDNYKLAQANITIAQLKARVRKDEAAIAADTKAEHGK